MRILVNAHEYDGWTIHAVAADAKTPISPFVPISGPQTIFRLLRYLGASPRELYEEREDFERWHNISCWVDLVPGTKNLLQIYDPEYLKFLASAPYPADRKLPPRRLNRRRK